MNANDDYQMVLVPAGEALLGTGSSDSFFGEASTDREKTQFVASIPEFLGWLLG